MLRRDSWKIHQSLISFSFFFLGRNGRMERSDPWAESMAAVAAVSARVKVQRLKVHLNLVKTFGAPINGNQWADIKWQSKEINCLLSASLQPATKRPERTRRTGGIGRTWGTGGTGGGRNATVDLFHESDTLPPSTPPSSTSLRASIESRERILRGRGRISQESRKYLARISQVSRKNLARTIKSNRFRLRSEISNLILYRDLHSSWKWRRRVWSNLDATIQPALKFRNSLDHSSVQQILKNELCWSLSVEPGPKPIGWNLTQFQDEMISGKRNDLSRLIKSGHWTESILSLFPLSLLIHSVHDCRRFNVYLMSWLDQIELNFEGERWPRRVISQ